MAARRRDASVSIIAEEHTNENRRRLTGSGDVHGHVRLGELRVHTLEDPSLTRCATNVLEAEDLQNRQKSRQSTLFEFG